MLPVDPELVVVHNSLDASDDLLAMTAVTLKQYCQPEVRSFIVAVVTLAPTEIADVPSRTILKPVSFVELSFQDNEIELAVVAVICSIVGAAGIPLSVVVHASLEGGDDVAPVNDLTRKQYFESGVSPVTIAVVTPAATFFTTLPPRKIANPVSFVELSCHDNEAESAVVEVTCSIVGAGGAGGGGGGGGLGIEQTTNRAGANPSKNGAFGWLQ
jgi:hypothetical protein